MSGRRGSRVAPRRDGLEVVLTRAVVERDGRRVLDRVDWRLRRGQRWVVLGANGAGKTQLLKLVAGRVWPRVPLRARAGRAPIEYRAGGERHSTAFAVRDRIAYVGPEDQDRYARHEWNFPVAAVVATGLHGTDIPLDRPTPVQHRRVAALLRTFGLERLARRRFLTLSYGQRRLVLLARAIATGPDLLLLDELLGGLDAAHRERVLRWLDSPAARRHGWVLSTHRPDETPSSASHRLELVAGRVRRQARLRARTAGARFSVHASGRPRRGTADARSLPTRHGEPLVALRRARVFIDWQPVLRGLTFAVHPGDAWVVHGPNGSGKTTLLRAIYGDFPVASGGMLRREGIGPGVPIARFREWCALLAPHLQTDYPRDATALETVVSGLRATYGLDAPADDAELSAARRSLSALGLGSLAARRLASLSYGQVRRVLFARALVRQPRLLLLDEPYAGVDRATRGILMGRVEALVGRGVAVVLATHHRDEWPRATTHELELGDGRAAYCGPLGGATGRRRRADGQGAVRMNS